MGGDFFLLYVIVLVLAAVGERPAVVAFGAAVPRAVPTLYESWWTSRGRRRCCCGWCSCSRWPSSTRTSSRASAERRRGDRSVEWHGVLEQKVAERTAELTRLYRGDA
jgi:hypothetical protein